MNPQDDIPINSYKSPSIPKVPNNAGSGTPENNFTNQKKGEAGKSVKAGGISVGLYWFGLLTVIFGLLFFPIYGLMFGNDTSAGIFGILSNASEYGIQIADIKQIFLTIIAILLIFLIVITPTKAFKSPLTYSWLYTMKGANDLSNGALIKEDPDKFKNIVFEVVVFGLISVGIFAMYVYLINGVVQSVNTNLDVKGALGLMINILVIAGLNSLLITFVSKYEPVLGYKNGNLIVPEKTKETDGGSKLLWGILIGIVNIVILSIGLIVSSNIIETIGNSSINNIIEGEATDIDDFTNLFN